MLLSELRRISVVAAPPRCACCGRPVRSDVALCSGCDADLVEATSLVDPGPPGIDLAVSAAPFEGASRAVVHGLKYRRRLRLASVAAERMLRACPAEEVAGAVVPVPAAPWRWRWRGFDPAEEIALAVARLAGLPLEACLRRSQGPRQVGRRRRLRLSAPPVVQLHADAPPRTMLVDDVYTTGASLTACAAALRSGGCERVVALTLARAL